MAVNVAGAVEARPVDEHVASHLHPEGSFDPEFFEVPGGREEIWRFTPLRRLRGLHEHVSLDGAAPLLEPDLAPGVTGTVVPVSASDRGASGHVPGDRVSARAWAAAPSVYEVVIPADTEVERATVLRLTGEQSSDAAVGQLLVRAGRHSKATVVVVYRGSATLAENVELVVEDGAQLTFVTIHDWADDTVHVASQHARVGRDAHLKHVAVTFGGDVVRCDTSASYAGPGGSAELLGLYFGDAGQHLEHRLFVDHDAPRTRSFVDYRGALQGQGAHTVWVGNVLIRKVAEGIDTYEQNRNLVLTDGCRADSVPNLEIETGEIEGAGHASTTGRFDDQQLFYLQSRGIPEHEARRLVVHGFFNEIIRRIGVPAIEERLIALVEAELEKNV